jgi:vancomycin resistance protein YoaR
VLFGLGLAVAAALLFVVWAVVGFEVATRDRVMPGVRILGVPVGGLNVTEASAELSPRATALLDQPLTIQFGDQTWNTSPRGMGLQLNPDDLAASAFQVGRDEPPLQLLSDQLALLRGGADLTVSRTATGDEVDTLLTRIASELDHPPLDAELRLEDDGTITFRSSQPGLEVDRAASREQIGLALTGGLSSVALVTHTLSPAVTTEQVAAAHDQLQKILGGDPSLKITAADKSWSIDRDTLQHLLVVNQPTTDAHMASVSVDESQLQPLVDQYAADMKQDPVDARFQFANGELTPIRESSMGRRLDSDAVTGQIETTILAGRRTADLPIQPVAPVVATGDGAKLGIRDLIDESSTTFAGSVPEKAHNIALAAQRLNGVVIPPGGMFSFNKEVGPTTLEAGFQWGFGLTTGGTGGVHTVPSVAGGICQVATTLFQPVFWAGYQLEERYWHLYWIPNYTSRNTVGLDATVDGDAGLDLKWINPTSDPVLIQSSASADKVTFSLYGRKPAWTVNVEPAVITNRVAPDPTPEVQEEPLLPWGRVVPVETAREGFQVQLVRHVIPEGGGPSRDLVLKSIYEPAHTVTLVGTGNAPDRSSVAAAVERVHASQVASLAPAPAHATAASTEAHAPPPAAPTTYSTPNGEKSLAQIRDELRRAGWGGGSDQDALETYNRVASEAH